MVCIDTKFDLGSRHDDAMACKCLLYYWLSVRGIHRIPMDIPHKEPWSYLLLTIRVSCWTNSGVDSELRHYDAHVRSYHCRRRPVIRLWYYRGRQSRWRWWRFPRPDLTQFREAHSGLVYSLVPPLLRSCWFRPFWKYIYTYQRFMDEF